MSAEELKKREREGGGERGGRRQRQRQIERETERERKLTMHCCQLNKMASILWQRKTKQTNKKDYAETTELSVHSHVK